MVLSSGMMILADASTPSVENTVAPFATRSPSEIIGCPFVVEMPPIWPTVIGPKLSTIDPCSSAAVPVMPVVFVVSNTTVPSYVGNRMTALSCGGSEKDRDIEPPMPSPSNLMSCDRMYPLMFMKSAAGSSPSCTGPLSVERPVTVIDATCAAPNPSTMLPIRSAPTSSRALSTDVVVRNLPSSSGMKMLRGCENAGCLMVRSLSSLTVPSKNIADSPTMLPKNASSLSPLLPMVESRYECPVTLSDATSASPNPVTRLP